MANIPGTAGPDTLTGTDFDDTINGLGGNDLVTDLAGNDAVFGGRGDDSLMSGGGNDSLFGGDGNDLLVINDPVTGGLGTAGAGDGDDLVRIFGTTGGTLQGGLGIDMLEFVALNSRNLMIDLDGRLMTGGPSFAPNINFQGFERLSVTAFGGNDTILGGALDDSLNAGAGRNTVDAKAGDDAVSYTSRDANTLSGGAGDDTLTVSSGQSNLYFIVDASDGSVDDGSLSVISGFEHFIARGGSFDDIASLGNLDDAFYGGDGRDTVFGGGGNDVLFGGRRGDSLDGGEGHDFLRSGTGDDTLVGGGGHDRLRGGAGSDLIRGGAGADRILFAGGSDTVTGGTGADSFQFTLPQTGSHTITDFTTGQDALTFAAANLTGGPATGPLDPDLLSLGSASGPQAQFVLTYAAQTDTTTLLWDQNGASDGGTEMLVQFTGDVVIMATDIFIL